MDTLFEEYGLALVECILCLVICSVLFGFVMTDPSSGEEKTVGVLPTILEVIPEEGD